MFVMEVIKSLVRMERNQHIMCDAQFPRELFAIGAPVIAADSAKTGHPLLAPFYYMIERLAAQAMHPRQLREFLRLDMPLCCRSLDEESAANSSRFFVLLPKREGIVLLQRRAARCI